MAQTNFGTGLDFDINEYRKKMVVVPSTPSATPTKDEKKEVKEEKDERKSSKARNETGSRIIAQIIGSLAVSLVGVLLFILLGGARIFTSGFEAREQMQQKYEQLQENANQDRMVNVQMPDGSVQTMTWEEMVLQQQRNALGLD